MNFGGEHIQARCQCAAGTWKERHTVSSAPPIEMVGEHDDPTITGRKIIAHTLDAIEIDIAPIITLQLDA